VAACLFVAVGACAAGTMPTESPYQGIVDRNVFNLRPIPDPTTNQPPPPPPPKITLTGITTILGSKEVLFNVAQPPRPPQPAVEKKYMLEEGQGADDITVLNVNPEEGTVRFLNHGTEQVLDIAKDGPKPPGGGSQMAANFQNPAGNPANPNFPNNIRIPIPAPAGTPPPVIPTRPVRTQQVVPGFGGNRAIPTTTIPGR
jgi:hypothetical protein